MTKDWNETLLSVTLLALGNTLADLFANGSLSSLGFAVMACTGTVSGQFFNLIMGFGLNMFLGSRKGPINFNLFKFGGSEDEGTFNLLIIGTVMAIILIILTSSLVLKFRFSSNFSKVVFFMYFAFLITAFGGFYLLKRG